MTRSLSIALRGLALFAPAFALSWAGYSLGWRWLQFGAFGLAVVGMLTLSTGMSRFGAARRRLRLRRFFRQYDENEARARELEARGREYERQALERETQRSRPSS